MWFREGYQGAVVMMVAVAMGLACQMVTAAPINYGDFGGLTKDYLNVTEAAGPGDTAPLYGAPNIVGDDLTFPSIQSQGFTASANGAGGNSDTTIGTLSFTLESTNATDLSLFSVSEGGDYGFLGLSGTNGAVFASLNVEIWDSSSKNTLLASKSENFSKFFNGPLSDSDFWQVDLFIDLTSLARQSVFVVINNNLQAVGSDASTAFIQKKQFFVSDAPEPATLVLLSAGALVALGRRRAA